MGVIGLNKEALRTSILHYTVTRNISYRELAKKTGVTKDVIFRAINGKGIELDAFLKIFYFFREEVGPYSLDTFISRN